MDVLLYNNKDEIVTIYTPNNLNYKNDELLTIKDEKKKYKVIYIEKYRKMDSMEHVSLELQIIK